MAEVLGFIEVTICIGEVVNSLYGFISTIKGAKDEIRRLTQELFALKGALEHFDVQTKSDPNAPLNDQTQSMLKMTFETLETIQKKLGRSGGGSFGRAIQQLTWPFRTGDVQKYLETLEKAKTWFIMVMMRDSNDTTAAVYDEMQKLSSVIHEDIIARKLDVMMKETDDLLKWLAPANSNEELLNSSKGRIPGTGLWIWDETFSLWENGQPTPLPFYWITGKSGSGKTVLFSSLVDELQTRCANDKAVARAVGYHCCSLDNAASQPVANVFGSILAQIGSLKPEILEHVRPLRHSGTSLIPQNNLTIVQIHEVMSHALKLFDTLYILVDALNETQYEPLLVATLLSLCEKHANLRVLATCTRTPVEPVPEIFVCHMSTSAVDLDIEAYVRYTLATDHTLKSLSGAVQADIRNKIVSEANGSFRWARLCMDRLGSLRTGRDIRRALNDIPPTLHETYAGIIERIPPQDQSIAREALMWLCFTLRLFSLGELSEAVVLDEDDTYLDNDCRLNNPAIILDICQGLIHVNNGTVTLAHDSIRSFLLSDWIRTSRVSSFAMDPAECHSRIMRKCLVYLRLEPFSFGPLDSMMPFRRRFADYPLIDYAATLWPIHSERFSLQTVDEERILSFFATKQDVNGGAFEAWVQFLLGGTDLEAIRKTEPLYYAASYNMVSVLKLLLKPELNIDLNRRGGRFSSPPLYVALWRGSIEAAKLLVEAGANPDMYDDSSGGTSRTLARSRRMTEITELMNRFSPKK